MKANHSIVIRQCFHCFGGNFMESYNGFLFLGAVIFLLDFGWLLFYYFYATVEVYNLTQGNKYQYLGHLWVKRKEGEYYLCLTEKMLSRSVTTQYKILPGSWFGKIQKKKKIRISFCGQYEIFTQVKMEITVKNHIATSIKL